MGTTATRQQPLHPCSTDAVAAATRASPLLSALAPDVLVTLVRSSHGTAARRGERIAAPTDDSMTVILEGVAAARVATPEGDFVIHRLLAPGDLHGLVVALGHEDPDELVAVDRVHALVVPGPALRDVVARVPSAARACLAVVAAELAALRVDQATFTTTSTTYRVEHRLLELADRFGQCDDGRVLVALPWTQEELASWARISRESTAKVLHELRAAGIVTTGRRELVIEDLAALRRRHHGRPDRTVAAFLGLIT